jgi:hypothetical protein
MAWVSAADGSGIQVIRRAASCNPNSFHVFGPMMAHDLRQAKPAFGYKAPKEDDAAFLKSSTPVEVPRYRGKTSVWLQVHFQQPTLVTTGFGSGEIG